MKKKKKDPKIKSSIVRDSIDTFGTNVFGIALSLIASLMVLNRVNPGVKGLYNTVQLWGSGLSTILGLSINSAVIYFVSRYKIQNTKESIKKLMILISAAILVIGSALMLILSGSQIFETTPAPYLCAIVIYGISSFILNICTAVLRGENKFRSYNMVLLIQKVLVTALAVVVFLKPSAAIWVWGTIGISLGMIFR